VFLDYIAGQILVANVEVVDGGHYLILDPASGAFLFVPWDLNNATWTEPEYPLAANTAYSMSWPCV
jgi:spore coat protein CotH